MPLVRKARVADVPQIYLLLKDFAAKELLLPRSLSDLYDYVRDFYVLTPDDDPRKVVGACALHVCWSDLGEIRSLALASDSQGADLGRRLMEACLTEARDLGLERVFALTYIPKYFERFEFRLIEKNELPQKIWADCFKCVKFPECDEIALERKL
ncbi:MAG: N-acetyltransferase [Proteobacteria bacterium]|nr:N-acetyltransferase [Pseudomonadota bacterium]